MTTITLDQKYVDILQTFGDSETLIEEALHHYLVDRIEQRLEKARQAVLGFEATYGMTYQDFYARTRADDDFVAQLWANDPTWEDDVMVWAYYEEVLEEWTARLKTLLTE